MCLFSKDFNKRAVSSQVTSLSIFGIENAETKTNFKLKTCLCKDRWGKNAPHSCDVIQHRAAARTLKVIKQESVELFLHVNVHRFTLWINIEFIYLLGMSENSQNVHKICFTI